MARVLLRGGLSFSGARRQEYVGGPHSFLRRHGLPKFESFFHTTEPGTLWHCLIGFHYNPLLLGALLLC